MKRTLISIGTVLSLLAFACLASTVSASPFVPEAWQQRVKAGPLEDERKHIEWARDLDKDFLDDAFNGLAPGEKTSVIVQLNDCKQPGELQTRFSAYGTVAYTGVILSFVVIHDVPQDMLEALAKDPWVAAVEKPRKIRTFNDTSTRVIRQRASNTFTPNTFAQAFGYDGSGVNIAIVDTGVDDSVHGAFTGKFVSGYNAYTSTVGNPDDECHLPRIRTGADGICDTTAAATDTQDVPVGQTPSNKACVGVGPNGVLDTTPGGDDSTGVFNWGGCTSAYVIATGTDGICNSTAAGDDYQIVPLGGRPPDKSCIGTGADGTIETVPAGDDTLGVLYHGTHVAGSALGLGVGSGCRAAGDGSVPNNCAGVAPGAGLVDVRVFPTNSGSTWDYVIIQALDWIFQDGNTDVVNMSLGACSASDGTDTLSGVINALVANDITVVVSAGNCWGNCIGDIASSSMAITVASANDMDTVSRTDDQFSKFSSFGPRVDFNPAAPTVGMLKPDITAPGSNICSVQGEDGNTTDTYHFISGTSMSAPHVAGAAALLIDMRYDIPPGAIKDLLKRTAFQTPQHVATGASYPAVDAVYNVNWGYGLMDLYEAGDLLSTGITDMSFTDCTGPHPSYPASRPCLLACSSAHWDNYVDIQLATDPPEQGIPNTITVTVENRGPSAAENVVVCVGATEWGVGTNEFYDVGCKEIANIAASASGSVNIPWTPTLWGHQCIQATIDYGFDTNFENNLTQLNVYPVAGSSPATANFRVSNPLNEKAEILLALELDDNAQRYMEAVNVEGVPIGEQFTMNPEDCAMLAQIQFFPNDNLPVGTKAQATVVGQAFSDTHPRGITLSGVTFNYQTVHPGLKRAYSCARHSAEGMIRIPIQLRNDKPTCDPRKNVQMVKAIFNVPMQPPDEMHDAIKISTAAGSRVPDFQASFQNGATAGTELTIEFTEPLPSKERYTFNFEQFVDLDGDELTGDPDFDLRVLQGDANGSGIVTATDISFVRGRINQAVEFGSTSCADVNQTGTITGTDVSYVRGRINSSAP